MSDYQDTAICPKCHGESRNTETCDLCGALIGRIRAREMEATAAQNEAFQSHGWETQHSPQEPAGGGSRLLSLFIGLVVIGAIMGGAYLYVQYQENQALTADSPALAKAADDIFVKSVFASDFAAEVENYSATPVVVDFYADWCGPCKMMGPHLDEFAGEYSGKVKVVKVNVDNDPDLAARFHVQGIPTLVVMKQGRETHRVSGGMTLPQLKSQLVPHL